MRAKVRSLSSLNQDYIRLHKMVVLILGKENAHFWVALGDRRHLLVASPLKEVERPLPPRLFYVSLGVPGQYSCKLFFYDKGSYKFNILS